jgi:hypothetical protein
MLHQSGHHPAPSCNGTRTPGNSVSQYAPSFDESGLSYGHNAFSPALDYDVATTATTYSERLVLGKTGLTYIDPVNPWLINPSGILHGCFTNLVELDFGVS